MKKIMMIVVMVSGVALAQETIPIAESISLPKLEKATVTNSVQVTGIKVISQQYMNGGNWQIRAMAVGAGGKELSPLYIRVLGTEITNHTGNVDLGSLTVNQLQQAVTEIAYAKGIAQLTRRTIQQ